MTEFILVKKNMQTRTRNVRVVKELIVLGWKVRLNELSELV